MPPTTDHPSPVLGSTPPPRRGRARATVAALALALPLALAGTASAAGPGTAAPSEKHCALANKAVADTARNVTVAGKKVATTTARVKKKRKAVRKARSTARRATARKHLVKALGKKVKAVQQLSAARQAVHVAVRNQETCAMAESVLPLVSPAVTGGTHAQIGNRTSVDLAAAGYSETEHFLSGTATSYRREGTWRTDGTWHTRPGASAPYTTRVVVRAPVDRARFNGTVVVEWLNVSGGVDVDVDFAYTHAELIRRGYAWVGVSAQQVGIDAPAGGSQLGPTVSGLKAWDPVRYAQLDHPGDDFSYDIFSQAGRALLRSRGADLLPGVTVKHLLAAGQSQSAMRMLTYANAVQKQADVYDGLLIHSRTGFGAPLNGSTPTPTPARVRTDLTVPVLQLVTETELFTLGGPAPENLFHGARQPDSATVRTWEMAGGAHSDTGLLKVLHPQYVQQFGPTVNPLDRLFGIINDAPQAAVTSAALSALHTWVRTGAAPAPAPVIETADGDIVRDEHGNALGGVRSPALDVPVATHTGENVAIPMNGGITPFPAPKLTALYPTHDAYVAAFTAAADRAVAKGWLLPEDAAAAVAAATAAQVPPLP